jgi:hypothetical protein
MNKTANPPKLIAHRLPQQLYYLLLLGYSFWVKREMFKCGSGLYIIPAAAVKSISLVPHFKTMVL